MPHSASAQPQLSLDRYMYYAALSTSRAFSIYGDHDSTHVRAQPAAPALGRTKPDPPRASSASPMP